MSGLLHLRALWSILRATYAPRLLRRLGVAARGLETLPEPPFLLVSDHAHALDPYVIGALSPSPIRFMANLEGVGKAKAALGAFVGAYGRRKGMTDLGALRMTFEIASAGDSIGIFPEGDRSWDGAGSPLRPGLGKLAKRLGTPLVIARQRGNYLSLPRWAKRPRRGPWTVDFLSYGADELAAMSDPLVDAIVERALAKDDVKDCLREGREFSGTGVAEGVERLLWLCPRCWTADSIIGRGDEVRCGACGGRWLLDANLRVRPLGDHGFEGAASAIVDLKDWNDWQVGVLPYLLESGGGIPAFESRDVELAELRRSGRRSLGRGRLSLAGGELIFESPYGPVAFAAAGIKGFVDNFNARCEFSADGYRWMLDFGGGNAVKWSYALALLAPRGRGAPDDKEAA
jgi:1-acyl-sn-glycerol-3-phosphate acyltransferase